jgi:hypothetical protein
MMDLKKHYELEHHCFPEAFKIKVVLQVFRNIFWPSVL